MIWPFFLLVVKNRLFSKWYRFFWLFLIKNLPLDSERSFDKFDGFWRKNWGWPIFLRCLKNLFYGWTSTVFHKNIWARFSYKNTFGRKTSPRYIEELCVCDADVWMFFCVRVVRACWVVGAVIHRDFVLGQLISSIWKSLSLKWLIWINQISRYICVQNWNKIPAQ